MNILSTPNLFLNNKTNSQPTSFQGNSRNLQKAIDEALRKQTLTDCDKLELSNRIKAAVGDVLTPNKFIGEGSHNAVYKITRKYVMRIPIGEKINPEELPDMPIIVSRIFKGLNNYFGEAIFKLGKIQILPNVGIHIPAGIPEHFSKNNQKCSAHKYYKEKYLPHFAKISQASYNELANDIAKLNEIKCGPRSYCLFDSINPNNIVSRAGRLFLVDEIDTLCDKSYSNTTAKLLEVFINRATKDSESPSVGNSIKFVRQIFKKVVIAADNASLLHADSKEDFANWQKALNKCKIHNNATDVIYKLEHIHETTKNPSERIKLIQTYINKLFAENPMNCTEC